MAKYECKVCGYIYNEQHAGRPFEELSECPICNESKANFIALDADNNPVVEEKAEEQATPMEEKAAEPFSAQEEESVEEVVSEKTEEAAPFSVEKEEKEDPFSIYKEVKEDEDVKASSDFVVERRQEFWSPLRSEPENKPVSNNTMGWTISNARGSVETVIGGEEEKEEAPVVQEVEKEDDSPFGSRIESFYSASEPVGMSHIVSGADEEEEPFKPLWNSGGGTVQRVIDPFGDKNEPVVKAESIDMVMPAEEPVVEEIFNGEDDVEENATSEPVEVKEFFDEASEEVWEDTEVEVIAEDEPAETEVEIFEAAEPVIEEVAEESAEVEVADTEVVAEEPVGVEVTENATATEEVTEDVEVVNQDEATEEPQIELYPFARNNDVVAEDMSDNEEIADDDFFTEMTMDAVVEPVEETVEETVAEEKKESLYDNPDYIAFRNMMDAAFPEEEEEEHHGDSSVSEEDVFKAIDAITFDDDVPEGGRIEVVTGEDTVAEGDDAVVIENSETEAEEEPFFDDEEEFTFVEAKEDADGAEEVEETDAEIEAVAEEFNATEEVEGATETVDEPAEAEETTEEPRIKTWSFLDDVVEAGAVTVGTVSGVNFVTKAMDEVVEEEVTDDDIEEVFVNFAEEEPDTAEHDFKTNLAEELFEAEDSIEEEKQEEVVEEAPSYCNNLEKILIVPAQLNPMPLPEGTEVEGRTVLGIASERPLVLDNPVFSTGAYNMVQYIPNSGLTSEDYQKADAIEIIVGHGNGIEKTINSKEDLRQVVNFLRLESDGCPIGIKMGAARIERDLEFCVFAKPDYVVLNNFSVVPLPYALHRATKFLNTVQSDMDIVIALDGAKDAEELAKIMAMGADVIALRNRPANMKEMIDGLKNYARLTGHYDVEDLNVKDLCTIDREIAAFTDIYHV